MSRGCEFVHAMFFVKIWNKDNLRHMEPIKTSQDLFLWHLIHRCLYKNINITGLNKSLYNLDEVHFVDWHTLKKKRLPPLIGKPTGCFLKEEVQLEVLCVESIKEIHPKKNLLCVYTEFIQKLTKWLLELEVFLKFLFWQT